MSFPGTQTFEETEYWRKWFKERARNKRSEVRQFLMWFRASWIFFKSEFHPITDQESIPIHLKNFTPELQILFYGLTAQMQTACQLIHPDVLERHKFVDYILNLLDDASGWSILQKPRFLKSSVDDDFLRYLDVLGQFRTLAYHFSQVHHLAYPAFLVLGRLYHQTFLHYSLSTWILQHPIIPFIDEIPNKLIQETIQYHAPKGLHHWLAWSLAKFYQWLFWLEQVPALTEDISLLKRSFMIFVLLNQEIRHMQKIWTSRAIENDQEKPWLETMDTVTFALQMEMKKIIHKELVGFPRLHRTSVMYMRLENCQGILRNAIQQGVIQLIHIVKPDLSGKEIFPSYYTKREQSIKLRDDLWALKQLVRDIWKKEEWERWPELLNRFHRFRSTSMRFLMYRDWNAIMEFITHLENARSPYRKKIILNQLNAFLGTLLKEICKRDVLRDEPFPYSLEDD